MNVDNGYIYISDAQSGVLIALDGMHRLQDLTGHA
jgi:hypothetical protein